MNTFHLILISHYYKTTKLKPVQYLIEEVLPHQKHDSHPILADYGTDQFSLRINDKGNNIVVKTHFHSTLSPLFKPNLKLLSNNITNLFINNLFSLMILMLQVMTKIISKLEF